MIKFQDGIPIYLQIVKDIKTQILSAGLKGGDKLPSVRELADAYQVNPNTVQRVYMELDREGLTYSERGIGTFVKDDRAIMETLRDEAAAKVLTQFVSEMKSLGFSKAEMNRMLNEAWSHQGGEQS